MSAVKSVLKASAGAEVPVIDMGPYLRGEPGALERTAEALGEASETIGFYFVGNHGVPQSLIERVFAETERFHALPLQRKLSVKVADRIVGYLPQGGQTQRTSVYGKSSHPDTSSSYYIRQEFPAEHPDRLAGKPWVFDNKWIDGLPGFRDTMIEYYAAMSQLVYRILRLQSVALGMGPDFLPGHDAFKPPVFNLRLLHYPPREQTLDGQFGIGPHTDYGHLTILAQERVPGLEILARDGQWIEAPAPAGHFLVNNADLCSRWTNDRFRSAPHRVINKTGERRHSIPFFTAPRTDVTLECLPSCHGPDNPPRYAPISYGEWVAEINRTNYDFLREQAKAEEQAEK
jgi:isopenicillin N synthase-like dioxygenase